MEINKILERVDHTLLTQTARWEEIKTVCDDGLHYKAASVCIPAAYVEQAARYSDNRLPICTVIGFPNGYSTTGSKCFEAGEAVKNGAFEIDMVINLGWLKDKKYDLLLEEINAVKTACNGRALKVIIETCLLTEDEKIKMCEIISDSNAEYIKTSTGFSSAGAAREDVKLFKEFLSPHIKIKASGGIRSLKDAEDFIRLGADRLGTSSIIKIVKEEKLIV